MDSETKAVLQKMLDEMTEIKCMKLGYRENVRTEKRNRR